MMAARIDRDSSSLRPEREKRCQDQTTNDDLQDFGDAVRSGSFRWCDGNRGVAASRGERWIYLGRGTLLVHNGHKLECHWECRCVIDS